MQLGAWLQPSTRRDLSGRKRANKRGLVRTGGPDDGFSMVEIVIAIAVFALVATFLGQMLAAGFKGVLLAKRREAATQETNRVIEIARSLAFNQIGLAQTDSTISTDSAITTQSGVKSYRSDNDWEPIMWATNPDGHPFNPHVKAITVGSTDMTRFVYVSGVDSDSDGEVDLKRISVRVAWALGEGSPRPEVRAQTLMNESGILPPGPGATGSPPPGCPAPCSGVTPMTAGTSTSAGVISVKSARGSLAGLLDAVLPTTPVTLSMPASSGSSKYRAISDITCQSTSATITGANSTYGGHSVSVTADDDAASATPSQPPASAWSGSPSDPINGTDDVANRLFETALASPVSCTATANDADGAPPADDGLPYEKGTASALGTLNLVENLTGTGIASSLLTAAGVQSTAYSQEIDHQTVGGTREVLASSNASVGLVNLLKIPGVFADGLVRIDGLSYGASIRTSGGTPSSAPTVTAPTINLRVYDPANEIPGCDSRTGGYCVKTVNPSASGFTGLSIDVEHNVLQNLGLTNLEFETHISILPPAKDPVDGVIGPNGERRWSAEYTPVSVSTRLKSTVTVNALLGIKVLLTDTKVDLNLGSVAALGCAGSTCL